MTTVSGSTACFFYSDLLLRLSSKQQASSYFIPRYVDRGF